VVGAVVEVVVDAAVVVEAVVDAAVVLEAVVDAVVVVEAGVGCMPLPLPLIESSSVVTVIATVVVEDPIRLSQKTPVYPGSQAQ